MSGKFPTTGHGLGPGGRRLLHNALYIRNTTVMAMATMLYVLSHFSPSKDAMSMMMMMCGNSELAMRETMIETNSGYRQSSMSLTEFQAPINPINL